MSIAGITGALIGLLGGAIGAGLLIGDIWTNGAPFGIAAPIVLACAAVGACLCSVTARMMSSRPL